MSWGQAIATYALTGCVVLAMAGGFKRGLRLHECLVRLLLAATVWPVLVIGALPKAWRDARRELDEESRKDRQD